MLKQAVTSPLMSCDTALPLVVNLCETLKTEAIRYCHWKSNAAIDRSASGENDLDLLVSRADCQRFTALLYRLGFKEAIGPRDLNLPGVRDFYGWDAASARLIHVHVHFQLVLGNDLSKNYHLPLERAYLESAKQGNVFMLPTPEFELALFVVRMVLKHSTLDAILIRHGQLSGSERRELEYLLSKTTVECAAAVLERHLPSVDRNLFAACTAAVQPGCSLWKRIQVGQQLQKALESCARRPQPVDVALKFWRRVKWPIVSRLHVSGFKKRMASGGMLIAVIGGDGSGKTTAVSALREMLSEEFDVIKVHMGKPSWSLTTIVIRGLVKVGRSFGLYPFVKEGTELSLDTTAPLFPGYPWLIREVCTARDRYLDYRRARRFATNGGLAICDRFPLAQLKIMDGPQVERLSTGIPSNAFLRWLTAVENSYYQRIMLPDLLLVLRVDPDLCVQRKTDEVSASVHSRAGEVWNVDWCNTPARVIDGSRSKAEVLSELLGTVWANL